MTWPPVWRLPPVQTRRELPGDQYEFPVAYRMLLTIEPEMTGRPMVAISCPEDCGCPPNPAYKADGSLQFEESRICVAHAARECFDLAGGEVPVTVIVTGITYPGGPWDATEYDIRVEVEER